MLIKGIGINYKKIIPYLFIAPSLTVLLIFAIMPIFQSISLAFMDYKIIDVSKSVFVGLENFKRLIADRYIWNALYNTVFFSIGTVFTGMLISLAITLVITESWFKFQAFARGIIFIPFVLSMTIVGLIWSWLYTPSFGLLNYVLRFFGVPPQQFLGDPRIALLCVIIVVVWKGLGYSITIWCAGILGISTEYREAARVDGASWIQELLYIRLPLLKPVILFLMVMGFIGSFQSFDIIYVMTRGGPMRRTEVIVYYLWYNAFQRYEISYASAIAWLIFIILIVLSLFQFKLLGKEA